MAVRVWHEGVKYEVDDAAGDEVCTIELPSGEHLMVDGWYETSPPQPHIVGLATTEQVAENPTFVAVPV